MKYLIDDTYYDVEIIKKSNKNTYLRVKNQKIIITTGYLTSKNTILRLLDENKKFIIKNLIRDERIKEREENFYFFGKKYDIIITPLYDVEFIDNKVYIKSMDVLDKWLKKQIKIIYKEHLDLIYNKFDENIPYPNLRIRSMKTRWGVCNRKNLTITLNYELYKYNIEALDYVIVHELSHLVHFDHSKEFWKVVEKYSPNYKKIKSYLKN